tara:strand:- start:389 stop:655 length:267 start_codon:yes stop_codon:yes gene_type:complete
MGGLIMGAFKVIDQMNEHNLDKMQEFINLCKEGGNCALDIQIEDNYFLLNVRHSYNDKTYTLAQGCIPIPYPSNSRLLKFNHGILTHG